MGNLYYPGIMPEEYNRVIIEEEFNKLYLAFADLQVQQIYIVPQGIEPARRYVGLVVNANGTTWDPGNGAGLYEYDGSAWRPLFTP